jgi:hypothetical protein
MERPMTDDPVAAAARAAAQQLSGEYGPRLTVDVEAALYTRDGEHRPERYFDPVELGSFLVSIAALAWQIYDSHRKKGERPIPPVLAREVRAIQRERTDLDGTQEKIIEVVTIEITKAAEDQ